MIKWGNVERTWREEIQMGICTTLLKSQYHGVDIGCILIGKNLDVLEQYLAKQMKLKGTKKFLGGGIYRNLFYVTNDERGIVQLKLLLSPERYAGLVNKVKEKRGLKPLPLHYPIDCDALTEEGIPVLMAFLPNIPRMIRFKAGLREQKMRGILIGFDSQQEMLQRWLGSECMEFCSESFNKISTIMQKMTGGRA